MSRSRGHVPLPWCAVLYALLTIVSSGSAAAGEGPLPRIYMEAIADGSRELGMGGVRFVETPAPPVIDGETVYFAAKLADGREGVFRSRRGVIEPCADTTTPIPRGRGAFTGFSGALAADGGRLAFHGTGKDGQQGVYALVGGELRRIADTSTAAPGGKRRFTALSSPAFAGRDAVFIGRPAGAGAPGLYRADAATGAITAVADETVAVPGGEARFRGVERVSGGGGVLVFTARDTAGGMAVYTLAGGALTRVVGTETRLPGAADERFAGFGELAADRSGETRNVVFAAPPPKDGQGGLNAHIDGAVRPVAEVRPGVVRGGRVLTRFESPTLYRDRMFCIAHSASGEHEIVAWRDGKWFSATYHEMTLGGRRPKRLRMSGDAVGAAGLAFHVTFEDGTQGIYLAHLREDAGRVVLSDALHGASLGRVSGGRFVEGGGWTPLADHERIVWNIPPMARNGMLEVDVRNFDPKRQAIAEKDIFMGLWGTLFNNHERHGVPHTDNWEIRVGTSEEQFKIEYHARGFGKAVHWAPFEVAFDPERTYRFRVEWRDGRMTTAIDDRILHFEGFSHEPLDSFRFLHVGTSALLGGKVTLGPIYSNVRIVSFD